MTKEKNERKQPLMAIWEIVRNAAKKGYRVAIRNQACPMCKEEATKVLEKAGFKTPPVWVTFNSAIKLYKNGSSAIFACPCGWRKTIKQKVSKESKFTFCDSHNCTSILTSVDIEEGYKQCYKCRANGIKPLPAPPLEAKPNCGCGRILPSDRKKFCPICRPRAVVKGRKKIVI
jgi:hypothetical protein